MAFDSNIIEFLSKAKLNGANFSETITIGRQTLDISSRLDAPLLLKTLGKIKKFSRAELESLLDSKFADEKLLPLLGAEKIDSIDKSDYEQATIVHDLNHPLPDKYKQKYDTVIDSGSLEHIFNFPVAIKNCLDLLKPGGTLIIITPANNYLGHGFYQFSPELFFRVLSPGNGVKIEQMLVSEMIYKGNKYAAADPEKAGKRVDNLSCTQLALFVLAKKVKTVARIEAYQSDYKKLWKDRIPALPKINPRRKSLFALVKRIVPQVIYRKLYTVFGSKKGDLLDKDLFKKIK